MPDGKQVFQHHFASSQLILLEFSKYLSFAEKMLPPAKFWRPGAQV